MPGSPFFSLPLPHPPCPCLQGIAQSLVALVRGLGPAMGSSILDFSLHMHVFLVLDYHLVFLICFLLSMASGLLSYKLHHKHTVVK